MLMFREVFLVVFQSQIEQFQMIVSGVGIRGEGVGYSLDRSKTTSVGCRKLEVSNVDSFLV